MTAKISAHADHRPEDVRFIRQRQDRLYVPLEKLEPRFSWLEILSGLGLAFFLVAVVVGTHLR